ncbi:MAG: aspartyl protease family protein [Armatimonadota bacterium]|jgi:clan AA aspartic protease
MGRVVVKVRIANVADLVLAQHGVVEDDQVRRRELEALADSGATLMCLPEDMAEELGLEVFRTETARLAKGERHKVPIARTLRIEIGDRTVDQDCMLLPRGTQPLVGHWVLQEMDLVIDCRRERLVPAHPEAGGPVYDLL